MDRRNPTLTTQHQIIYELASFLADELGEPDDLDLVLLPLFNREATDTDRASAVDQLFQAIERYDTGDGGGIEDYLSDAELGKAAFDMLAVVR